MDIQRLRTLAALTESTSIRVVGKSTGQLGKIVAIEGEGAVFLAKMFKIPSDWKLQSFHDCFAAFDGERLAFFEKSDDWEPAPSRGQGR